MLKATIATAAVLAATAVQSVATVHGAAAAVLADPPGTVTLSTTAYSVAVSPARVYYTSQNGGEVFLRSMKRSGDTISWSGKNAAGYRLRNCDGSLRALTGTITKTA